MKQSKVPTEDAVLRKLRADTIQHWLTLVPWGVGASSLVYALLVAPVVGGFGIALLGAVGGGVVGAANLVWRFVRLQENAQQRIAKIVEEQQEKLAAIQAQELDALHDEIAKECLRIRFVDGESALRELDEEYQELQRILGSQESPAADVLSVARLQVTAAESYRHGLQILMQAVRLKEGDDSRRRSVLEGQVKRFEREIKELEERATEDEFAKKHLELRRTELASHRERLNGLKQLQLDIADLLHEADQLEAGFSRTSREVAKLRAGQFSEGLDSLREQLRGIVATAVEVQEIIRKSHGLQA